MESALCPAPRSANGGYRDVREMTRAEMIEEANCIHRIIACRAPETVSPARLRVLDARFALLDDVIRRYDNVL